MPRNTDRSAVVAVLMVLLLALATGAALVSAPGSAAAESAGAPNPQRNAYFGETHVHTSWSLDSFLGFGVTLGGPEEFYKYSMGQPIRHPGGYTVKIASPLDLGGDDRACGVPGCHPGRA